MIKGNINVYITHPAEMSLPDHISPPHLQKLWDLKPKFGTGIISGGIYISFINISFSQDLGFS